MLLCLAWPSFSPAFTDPDLGVIVLPQLSQSTTPRQNGLSKFYSSRFALSSFVLTFQLPPHLVTVFPQMQFMKQPPG